MLFFPQVFRGNNDQTTWKRHCFHRYYGEPIVSRFVRVYPVRDNNGVIVSEDTKDLEEAGCPGMRVELYGFRDADDPQLLDSK